MGDTSDYPGFVWRLDDADQRKLFLEQWDKCEKIAMHFNELIIRFRTQAMGGLAVIGSVLGLARGADKVDYRMLGIALLALLILWIGIFLVDHIYYSRLLMGAVDELKRLEAITAGAVRLSTRIEERCGEGDAATNGRLVFYALPALALIIIAVLCLLKGSSG